MGKAAEVFEISYRCGFRLLQLNGSSFMCWPKPKPDDRALSVRIGDLAALRMRYGYRRPTVFAKARCWPGGPQSVSTSPTRPRGLEVRIQKRKKWASLPQVQLAQARASRQHRSMDFMEGKLADGRCFRVLTVVDRYDRSARCSTPISPSTPAKSSRCWREHR